MRKAERSGRARVLGRVLVMVVPLGCSQADPGASGTSRDSSTGDAGASTTTVVMASTSATTGFVDDTRGTSSSEATGVVFLLQPDGGHTYECNIITQDCPRGEKCAVWDEEGGSHWNATRCVPVPAQPR